MRATLRVRNATALALNFRRYADAEEAAVLRHVQATAHAEYAAAYAATPVDQGTMRARLRVWFSEPRGFTYQLGWDSDDFTDFRRADPKTESYTYPQQTIPHWFYPGFVVYGTQYVAGRDPLAEARRTVGNRWTAGVRSTIRAAGRPYGGRG